MSSANKIRVAVLTRGDSLESWEVAALEKVKQLPFVEIALEIVDGTAIPKKTFFQKISGYKWNRLFWNRWFRKYGKVNATEQLSVYGDNQLPELFHAVHRQVVIPELKGKHSQHFSAADIEMVKWYKPDVILRFGFNILRGEILNVAPHGIWSFHHADPETIRGGPAGFWEYILRHNITGAILQRLTDKLDDGIVLRSGYWSLVKHSFRENLDALLNNTSGWMANALTEIHLNGKIANATTVAVKGPVYSYPGNFRMLQFWCMLLRNKIAFHWNDLFLPETWKIGIVDQPIEAILESGIQSTPMWIEADNTSDYLADPFAASVSGEEIILAEKYSYTTGKGEIVAADIGRVLLTGGYHLSFPFTIEVAHVPYVMPEKSGRSRLTAIPLEPMFQKNPSFNAAPPINMLDEPAVDAVVFQFENRWWLFCHLLNNQNNAALFIYYADKFEGAYTPHALNPVKTDIRNSRSAGAILNINGKLIRPAQDSAITYGNAIVLNEITELTPTSFAEKAIKRIEPKPDWEYNKGIHTLSQYGNQTLIDAKSFRFNFANFKAQLSRKARRISGK